MNVENLSYKPKPFVKWVGGKTQLLSSIKKMLPINFPHRKNLTYIEPFVGGGAVLFWILKQFPNIKQAIINDINPDLTNAFNTIKNHPYELIDSLKEIRNQYLSKNNEQRKEFYLEKRELFNTLKIDILQNTTLFIFLNRTCFNGLYRVNSKGFFNVPFGKYENPKICDEQTILDDNKLLQKVKILTGDFEETLKYATPNSFFYFDPPYKPLNTTSNFNSYSKEVFGDEEQIRLGKFCQKIHHLGHSFILSNSDVKGKNEKDEFFDNLYKSFDIQRVFAKRMVNANPQKRGQLTELLISNEQLIDGRYERAI